MLFKLVLSQSESYIITLCNVYSFGPFGIEVSLGDGLLLDFLRRFYWDNRETKHVEILDSTYPNCKIPWERCKPKGFCIIICQWVKDF